MTGPSTYEGEKRRFRLNFSGKRYLFFCGINKCACKSSHMRPEYQALDQALDQGRLILKLLFGGPTPRPLEPISSLSDVNSRAPSALHSFVSEHSTDHPIYRLLSLQLLAVGSVGGGLSVGQIDFNAFILNG